jgi:hypothetical protein
MLDRQESTHGTKSLLKAGSRISVLGSGPLANGLDGTWIYPVTDVVRIRAIYHTSTWRPGFVIISDWAEVKVDK